MGARMRSPGLVAAALVLAAAGRALGADPDPSAPSVCAPPCASGEICVGSACVAPDLRPRRPARPPDPAPILPAAPPGSAPTTGPQPDPGPAPPDPSAPPPAAAQAPPPPAYAPPPGYPSAPPPGYYYAPPPGYAYAPPPPALYAPLPRQPRTKRAFLVLPQLGTHSYQNMAARSYDPGLRVGSIVGGRFSDRLSLDADMTFDVSNVHGVAPGDSFREWTFALAICSLFQIPVGPLEFLTGPKAGYAFGRAERRMMGVTEQDRSTALLVGLDAGVFMPVSPQTSLGVLLSLEFRFPQHVCRKTTGVEICDPYAGSEAAKIVGLSAGALF
jgi:hypothetical protein